MTLKPWRKVIEPHPDVAKGQFQAAQFAANLAKVHFGSEFRPRPGETHAGREYTDPVEFFQRTFLTNGMRRLLVTALKRLSGKGGDPVVQLKTAFGGGKTHTMLALYHLFGGTKPSELRDVGHVMEDAEVLDVPRASRAVLVGTDLDPTKPRVHPKLDNLKVHTLWGELAAQLGGREGYELVSEADRTGTAPGAATLKELLTRSSPCIIFVDELVAYARNMYGKKTLSGGTFDSVLTFVHNLNDAVEQTPGAMLVASIPESDIEIGGDAGQAALERIEHTFARLEAQWAPVSAEEGFEIVRRRLFMEVQDEAALEATCKAFHELYRGSDDFPRETKEKPYLDRVKSTYPVHPEIFDRLYGDWSTLERFQRTRGVLRFLAEAIHELWNQDDQNPLIMPGTIPFDDADVRNELLRYLPDSWFAVVDTDIDGPKAAATGIDRNWPRIGQILAARKTARTIFLGSAPSVKEQRLRGIERNRILLGAIQPGDSMGAHNDALARLLDNCTYLYPGQNRYWFDTKPSLRRTAEDKASQMDPADVRKEIRDRLKSEASRKGDFAAVHVDPSSGSDVRDDDAVRLVILGPKHPARDGGEYPAQKLAQEILEKRGENSPRDHKNMLVFVAADKNGIEGLDKAVRQHLAWLEIKREAKQLGLDGYQLDQVEEEIRRSDGTIDARLQDAYQRLLVPTQPNGTGPIQWVDSRIAGTESIVERAARQLKDDEAMIDSWSPALLRMEMDKWNLWGDADHVTTAKVWEYLTSYVYLPRLKDRSVLESTIRAGIRSPDHFGYADAVDGSGKYKGLVLGGQAVVHINGQAVLIKPETAQESLGAPQPPAPTPAGDASGRPGAPAPAPAPVPQPPAPGEQKFWAQQTVEDPTLVGPAVGQLVEGVIELLRADGAKVRVTIHVEAEKEGGFSAKTQSAIKENIETLKARGQFEKG